MIALALMAAPALAVDRERVLDNAVEYTTHTWTMTEENLTADCSSSYESQYSPGTWVGLPYDWGGYMTTETFDEQIAAGYGAGSHSWHGSLSCTAGLDCSGFLSMVWETGHYSTSTFDAVTDVISVSDLDRADGFNKAGSHCALFAYETAGGIPVFYEAAGTPDKVRINADSGWSYLNGYDAIRFEGIEDGASTGTADNPVEIDAFPFTDLRWTAGAASDVLDAYSCAPDTDESGPEVLYIFTAAEAGTLEVVVSDDSGVDIDIHVLTGPSEDACLARDDAEVSLTVGPGEVWLALDTYVGSREYPGPYLLTATFTGALGDPPADDDPGGDAGEDPGDEPGGDTGPADPDGGDTGADAGGDGPGGAAPPSSGASSFAWDREPMSGLGGCSAAPGVPGRVLILLALLCARRRSWRGHNE